MKTYQVIVRNVGTIYSGSNEFEACRTYDEAVASSKLNCGRDAGEPVTLVMESPILGTEILREYAGTLADERLVRLCRFCAQKLDLWMEWKSNHCLYDHATSKPCDECDGANLSNSESIFTVKLRLPNCRN